MIAQPRVRKAWWMSARISQRIRSRRNQRRSAKAASTTQRFLPRPLPRSVMIFGGRTFAQPSRSRPRVWNACPRDDGEPS